MLGSSTHDATSFRSSAHHATMLGVTLFGSNITFYPYENAEKGEEGSRVEEKPVVGGDATLKGEEGKPMTQLGLVRRTGTSEYVCHIRRVHVC